MIVLVMILVMMKIISISNLLPYPDVIYVNKEGSDNNIVGDTDGEGFEDDFDNEENIVKMSILPGCSLIQVLLLVPGVLSTAINRVNCHHQIKADKYKYKYNRELYYFTLADVSKYV